MVVQGVDNKSGSGSAQSSGGNTVRGVVTQMKERTQALIAKQRPWTELMDWNAFRKPASVSAAFERIKENVLYFRMNYIIFLLIVIALSLLWHPISLVVLIVLVVAWIYLYFGRSEPLIIFNRTITEGQVLIFLGVVSIIALFLTNVTFILIYALIVGILVICLHGAFRSTDDLYHEQQTAISSRV